jgi:hypothetical protein
MKTTHACLFFGHLSTTIIPAQDPRAAARDREPAPPALRALSERPGFWRVPIHTHSDAAGYGFWAADRDYKASFHDGFVFYPRPASPNPMHVALTKGLRSVVR